MSVYRRLDLVIGVGPSQHEVINVKGIGAAALQDQLIVDGSFANHRRILDIFADRSFDRPLAAKCGESR